MTFLVRYHADGFQLFHLTPPRLRERDALPNVSINGSSWVTMMTEQPASRAPAISFTISVHVVKSWPNVGSSITKTFGAAASMEQRKAFFFRRPIM